VPVLGRKRGGETLGQLVLAEARLFDDARAAPWVGEMAFHAAALELAQAGIAVLRKV